MRPEKKIVLAVRAAKGRKMRLVFLVAHKQRPMPFISWIYEAIAMALSSLSVKDLAWET